MQYRRLGQAGIKVSEISFGSWVTFSNQMDISQSLKCIETAYDYGINFFDNAEVYAAGQSEIIMGEVFKKMNKPRLKYLVTTKFFWGISEGPNERHTLNRKYLMNGIQNSLKRLQMDFVDVVYCHRADPLTPMEEIVWAMSDMIDRGYALYWGTSEWSAEQIEEAMQIAEKYHLRKPVTEQPQYNLLNRDRFENEYAPLFQKYKLGTTTWSPLASGVLSGKYLNGVPTGSRLSMENLAWLKEEALQPAKQSLVKNFVRIADELSVSPSALAIAWCLKNPNVSTVITGASRVEQIHENMKALDVVNQISDDVYQRLNHLSI